MCGMGSVRGHSSANRRRHRTYFGGSQTRRRTPITRKRVRLNSTFTAATMNRVEVATSAASYSGLLESCTEMLARRTSGSVSSSKEAAGNSDFRLLLYRQQLIRLPRHHSFNAMTRQRRQKETLYHVYLRLRIPLSPNVHGGGLSLNCPVVQPRSALSSRAEAECLESIVGRQRCEH